MDKLRIYVCGHDNGLDVVPDRPFLRKVNLAKLPIGVYQDNQLSESRAYMWDGIQESVEYVGFISQRYRQKFPHLTPFQGLDKLTFEPDLVYCADMPYPNWSNWFFLGCPGIEPLMYDMAEFAGMSLENYPTLVANSFICSWDVFQEFYRHWRKIFDYLYIKYPPHSMTFETFDNTRRAGALYEALTAMIFGHLIKEKGLRLEKMVPKKNTVFTKRRLFVKT